MSHLKAQSQYVRLQDHTGANLETVPVSNAGMTELAAAINASNQMDVNIAASSATVPVSNTALTNLDTALNASNQLDVNLAASSATVTVSGSVTTSASEVTAANNAWDSDSVSTSGASSTVDLRYCSKACALIECTNGSTIKLQFAADAGSDTPGTWCDSGDSISIGGSSTGVIKFDCGARFALLVSTESGAGDTISASIVGKQ